MTPEGSGAYDGQGLKVFPTGKGFVWTGHAGGRWVCSAQDCKVITGWAARTPHPARRACGTLGNFRNSVPQREVIPVWAWLRRAQPPEQLPGSP